MGEGGWTRSKLHSEGSEQEDFVYLIFSSLSQIRKQILLPPFPEPGSVKSFPCLLNLRSNQRGVITNIFRSVNSFFHFSVALPRELLCSCVRCYSSWRYHSTVKVKSESVLSNSMVQMVTTCLSSSSSSLHLFQSKFSCSTRPRNAVWSRQPWRVLCCSFGFFGATRAKTRMTTK